MAKLFTPEMTHTDQAQDVQPASSKKGFTLEEVYKLLGCDCVEVVGLERGMIMLIDEEGKCHTPMSPYNPTATIRAAGRIDPSDIINGKALVCKSSEFK